MALDDEPLYVSKRNRRGVVALVFFSVIIIFLPRFAQLFNSDVVLDVSTEDVQAFEKAVAPLFPMAATLLLFESAQ